MKLRDRIRQAIAGLDRGIGGFDDDPDLFTTPKGRHHRFMADWPSGCQVCGRGQGDPIHRPA